LKGPGERRIPDVLLERHLLSLLKGEALERVEQGLAESEADRARLEELRAESSAFLVSHPLGPLDADLEKRLETRRRRRWWWGAALVTPALVGLGVLVFVLVRPERPPPQQEVVRPERPPSQQEVVRPERPPSQEQWAAKGNTVLLRVYRQQAAGAERLDASSLVVPGDQLWFAVGADEPGYLAVLGRDGAGRVSVYYPQAGRTAVASSADFTPLPAFELGDIAGRVDIDVLFFTSPFELEPALRALEAGKPVKEGLPPGVQVMSRVLRSEREP
jgi:hypothetical protein